MFIITADRLTTSSSWWERLSVNEDRVVLVSEPDAQEPQTLVLATLESTEQAVVLWKVIMGHMSTGKKKRFDVAMFVAAPTPPQSATAS